MMTSMKEDTNQYNSSPLNWCQSTDSFRSASPDQDDGNEICNAINTFVISRTKENQSSHSFGNPTKIFAKRAPVDVSFEDIKFTSTQWKFKRTFYRETKHILHGVSGTFKSGELTVIMGPSGAGKSTLLNGLAGYVFQGFEGTVCFDDEERNTKSKVNKLIAYIPQHEELRLALTVIENMTIAADLKLGPSVSLETKVTQITEILEMLGLQNSHHSLTFRLSGGQRKRLAIALELLSNPQILFLDEPTTGLDSLSCSQCVSLLKKLAHDGRTVICTIHQPSALLFEMFDRLYVLAEGQCIFDGKVDELLPQLGRLGLQCPSFHNPADFLMEVAIGEYGTEINDLAELQRECTAKRIKAVADGTEKSLSIRNTNRKKHSIADIVTFTIPKPPNNLMQFVILYKRNMITAKRQYKLYLNRILANLTIGIIIGYLYANVGNSAQTFLANYVFLYGSILLLVHTGLMPVTISFPMEIQILKREYFNRWFRLGPYLSSLLLVETPFQITCCLLFILTSYFLTGQLVDYRIYIYIIFVTTGSMCAQSWGYLIGANFPISIAIFIGPVITCVFSVFGFNITYIETPFMFKWLYHISYFRASFHGVMYAIYGIHRPDLHCPDELVYCHYQDPTPILVKMGIGDLNVWGNASIIVITTILLHLTTFVCLWFKLNRR